MGVSKFFGKSSAEGLPPYGYRYLEHILGDVFAALKDDEQLPERIKAIQQKVELARAERSAGVKAGQQATILSWSDTYRLERYLLSRDGADALRRRAWFLRLKYREVLGQRAFDAYTASKPPDETHATESELRADLERILIVLHRTYMLVPLREQMRTGVVRTIAKWLLIVLVAALPVMAFFASKGHSLISAILLVALAGAAGGFISLQQRIQRIPTDGDPLLSIFELQNGLASIYLAPISGAVFAVLLFLVFTARLVEGAIFPEISAIGLQLKSITLQSGAGVEAASAVHTIGQPHTQAFAKLLVWSFIAGFAERFVPDTLSRLTDQRSSAADSAALPSPSPAARRGDGGTESATDQDTEEGAQRSVDLRRAAAPLRESQQGAARTTADDSSTRQAAVADPGGAASPNVEDEAARDEPPPETGVTEPTAPPTTFASNGSALPLSDSAGAGTRVGGTTEPTTTTGVPASTVPPSAASAEGGSQPNTHTSDAGSPLGSTVPRREDGADT